MDSTEVLVGKVCTACIFLVIGFFLVHFTEKIYLKYILVLGFLIIGTGLFLQSLETEWGYFPPFGSMLVEVGQLSHFIGMAFIAKDWFLEGQRLTVISLWQLGRVAGKNLAFILNYYYFDLYADNVNEQDLRDKYIQIIKIYIALSVSSAIIVLVYVKSVPQGTERSRKIYETPIIKHSVNDSGRPFIDNTPKQTKVIRAPAVVQALRMSSFQKAKVVIGDKFIWAFGLGCLFPLAATDFAESHIVRDLKVFAIRSVDHH